MKTHGMLCVLNVKLHSALGVLGPKKGASELKRLGRNLAQPRTAAGFTQEGLAEKAGISTRYVQDLEAGQYAPTIFLADSLRRALGCDWSDLLKGC